jgi:VIT1/CCC1 family predicted Fe2+/Mn2+ transporter
MREETKKLLLKFQKYEITEYHVYKALSERFSGKNQEILRRIAEDEERHYKKLREITGEETDPHRFAIKLFLLVARVFGLTFAIKMMERGEERAESGYRSVLDEVPEAKSILDEEFEHEKLLLEMIDEVKIGYIGSMVLGLNDALVELTGALAGLTFALRNTRLVGVAGFITGLAASLSMAASEYLSTKSEATGKSPLRASFYTGVAYVTTVLLLVFPFFLLHNPYMAILLTLLIAILIVFFFSFFVAVVRGMSFWRLLFEMLIISLGVATISFLIGILVRKFLKVEVG